jgi:hypothetical protein
LSVLLAITLCVALIPTWREKAQSALWPHERIILAKSQGPIEPTGTNITVVKIKTREGLFIEIYKNSEENSNMEFWMQFPLEGSQDGFFNFQNQASNLVLTDVDNDGYIDIMVPTFDDQQQARMNVFRYDPQLETFVRMERQ